MAERGRGAQESLFWTTRPGKVPGVRDGRRSYAVAILFGLFLLGHGLAHASWLLWWPGGGPRISWLLTDADETTLRGLSTTLSVLAAVDFFTSGLCVLVRQGSWRPLAMIASVVSLLLLVLFWNRGFFMGAAFDVTIYVIALWWGNWPPASRVLS